MDRPSAPSAGDPPRARRPWTRWRKIFAVLGALILVFVGGYVLYGYLNGLPPELLASGGSHRVLLDAALMTFYTPSIPGATDYNATVTVVLAAGEHFPFQWGSVQGASLPVRFALAPSDAFTAASPNGFVYGQGGSGPASFGSSVAGASGAYASVWSMTYEVRELSAWEGFSKTSWLEVDYDLTPVVLRLGALPWANVTAPGPSDLIATGVEDALAVSAQPGSFWSLDRSLSGFTVPSTPFQHSLPPVDFDAGTLGGFTASLSSTFRWSKGDDYHVTMRFSGTVDGTLRWYWDARFGSLVGLFGP